MRTTALVQHMWKAWMLACLLGSISGGSYAQPGTLDPSLNGDGIRTYDLGPNDDFWNDVTVLADGHILTCGWDAGGCVVAKFHADGAIDTTFGNAGLSHILVGSTSLAQAITVQPDGKIVLAGQTESGGWGVFTVFRMLPNGDPDPGFGTGGYVATPMQSGSNSSGAEDVKIQTDGRIVAAGWGYGQGVLCIVRYDTAGVLDPGFSMDGKAQFATDSLGYDAAATCAVVQANGRIIAGAFATNANDVFIAVRVLADGSLDPSFDGDGVVTTSFGTTGAWPMDVVLQDDGRVILGGYVFRNWTVDQYDFALARYDTSGSLDGTFGVGGRVLTTMGPTSNDLAFAMCLQPDGKSLVTGRSFVPGAASRPVATVRYKTDGTVDASFGVGGRVLTDLGSIIADGNGIALQPDGRIVVAGDSSMSAVLLRYLNDIALGAQEPYLTPYSIIIHPAPAGASATITYFLGEAGSISLKLFDGNGRSLRTIHSGTLRTAGVHSEPLDLSGLPTGVYALVLAGPKGRTTARVLKE